MSLIAHRSPAVPHAPLSGNSSAVLESTRRAVAAVAKEVYPAVVTLSIFGTLVAGVLAIRLAAWFIRFHY